MSKDRPIEAELVDVTPGREAQPGAPLRVELNAWPKLFKADVRVTENGKVREYKLDGSMVAMLVTYIKSLG